MTQGFIFEFEIVYFVEATLVYQSEPWIILAILLLRFMKFCQIQGKLIAN